MDNLFKKYKIEKYKIEKYKIEKYKIEKYKIEKYKIKKYKIEKYKIEKYKIEKYKIEKYKIKKYKIEKYKIKYKIEKYKIKKYKIAEELCSTENVEKLILKAHEYSCHLRKNWSYLHAVSSVFPHFRLREAKMGQELSSPGEPKTEENKGNKKTGKGSNGKNDSKDGGSSISKKLTQNSFNNSKLRPGMFIQNSNVVFNEQYKGIKILGKGSFGEVILSRDKHTGHEYAIKVISKKHVKRKTDKQSLLREVELLKMLDHINIMKLYEFFEDNNYYYLVSDVYSGGELFDEIISRKRFYEIDAARIIKQVLSGITYMHKNNVVHRDLKPENILLETKNKEDMIIKIIDFGLSTHFEYSKKMKDKIGTAYYIAPDVLHGTYDEKCDIWSCGVILYILLS
ncbi:calcium-dependent protein kinase 4, putative, partial [Plasmodium malariae]